ncbi:helix-turn-helix domain-containing protein [Rhodococcus sp. HNM0569]|uniref:helix-turn-helix domain-containing protein n=1 Tax=Rhodococcus sp. HNM0569 TaxID=2716340 RepID=UPI00146BF35B|nr:helix-turn-helix domain-containing protein [Rhodococcus sp. HNM0569]NLU85006.1 helix-turn-helix domain-containing protein [Rhodococcus sp. HNM0569]
MYRERRIAGLEAVLWQSTADGPGPGTILPDGCMDLVVTSGRVLVAGPDTRAVVVDRERGATATGLRFDSGVLPALLGVPARELTDLREPLEQVRPDLVPGEFDGTAGSLVRIAVRARAHAAPDPVVREAARLLRRGAPVRETAGAIGYGERQLRRMALQHFGYGPKTLSRIARFQRALALAGTMPAADIARDAGYADQAHLVRECTELTGTSFGALTR